MALPSPGRNGSSDGPPMNLAYIPYQRNKGKARTTSTPLHSIGGTRSLTSSPSPNVHMNGSRSRSASVMNKKAPYLVSLETASTGSNRSASPTFVEPRGTSSAPVSPPPLRSLLSSSGSKATALKGVEEKSSSPSGHHLSPGPSTVHPYSFAGNAALRAEGHSPREFLPIQPRADRMPYRDGFQPKGVIRKRTEEFQKLRAKSTGSVELDDQRMERRLGKLLKIYSPAFEPPMEIKTSFLSDPRGFLRRGGEQVLDMFHTKHEMQKHRLDMYRRHAEQDVVKWQEDALSPNCAICSVPFSLAIRRHHCRLCGRTVCSSPQLPRFLHEQDDRSTSSLLTKEPCSSLMFPSPSNSLLHDLPQRPPAQSKPSQWRAFEAAELYAIRFCRDCKVTVHRIQFPIQSREPMALISDYEALRHLQQEMDEALPDFHEMLLGLKKNDMDTALASTPRDNCALQADAIQARKDLLARFSQFDQLARKIERLPPTVHGLASPTQKRLQQAIFSQATIYLQRNMFPLQSLPVARKEKNKSSPSTSATNLPLEAQQQINVLSEQEALLSSYLEAAKKARNLDDVLSLKQSQDEIRAEIEQIIAKHTM